MTSFFRLKDDLVSVDGILCQMNEYDGRYYPIREDLYNVSLFPDAVDCFLIAEDKMNKAIFEDKLEEILFYTGINFPDKF